MTVEELTKRLKQVEGVSEADVRILDRPVIDLEYKIDDEGNGYIELVVA